MTAHYRAIDRNLLIGAHVGLIAAVITTLVGMGASLVLRLLLVVLLLTPLAASFRGVLHGHRKTIAWLSLALVGYSGLGMVEVIATQSAASIALLLFALIELALVIRLLRFLPAQSPDATGES